MNVCTHTALLTPEKYDSQTTDQGVDKRQIDKPNLYFLIIKAEVNAKRNDNSRSTTTSRTTTTLNEKITLRVDVF